jgi:acetate kinase
VMTRQILSDLHELIPLAPLHQPYNPLSMPSSSACLRCRRLLALIRVFILDTRRSQTSFHCQKVFAARA